MSIDLNLLVAVEDLSKSPEDVFKKVDEFGEVVIIRNNQPAYYIKSFAGKKEKEKVRGKEKAQDKVKVASSASPKKTPRTKSPVKKKAAKKKGLTQKEAVLKFLQASPDHQAHASEIADAVFDQGLYVKRDGSKASATQVRAMCGQYKDLFETLEGNRIRLKDKA